MFKEVVVMIQALPDFKVNLHHNEEYKYYEIFSYERIMIGPNERKLIILPYKVVDRKQFLYFTFNFNHIMKGITCEWDNLNEEGAKTHLTFLLYNNNSVISTGNSLLSSIIRSDILDIRSNQPFGKIYY